MALQEELEQQGSWLFRYRGTVPILFFITGFAEFLYSEYFPERFLMKDNLPAVALLVGSILISLFGLWIRIYTVGHTPKNTSGRNVGKQLADSLNTTGIYSTVRHPLYLGNFFMWLGPAVLTGSIWFIIAFILCYWIYYERIMYAEEHFLRNKFKETYLHWAAGVPAFVPSVRHFVKPALPFSWKKVLKKEKNGLAAIFLIFYAMDSCSNFIQHEDDYFGPLFYLAIGSLVLYFILKLIKKKKVLHEVDR